MKNYFLRAGRAFLKFAVILVVVFAAMSLTGTLRDNGMPLLRVLFAQPKGLLLLGVIVVWALVHPFTNFMKDSVRMTMDRERVVNAFASVGYKVESEQQDEMTFRAISGVRRLLWNFDDRVTVRQDGGFVDFEGLKRIVPRVILRLKAE